MCKNIYTYTENDHCKNSMRHFVEGFLLIASYEQKQVKTVQHFPLSSQRQGWMNPKIKGMLPNIFKGTKYPKPNVYTFEDNRESPAKQDPSVGTPQAACRRWWVVGGTRHLQTNCHVCSVYLCIYIYTQ